MKAVKIFIIGVILLWSYELKADSCLGGEGVYYVGSNEVSFNLKSAFETAIAANGGFGNGGCGIEFADLEGVITYTVGSYNGVSAYAVYSSVNPPMSNVVASDYSNVNPKQFIKNCYANQTLWNNLMNGDIQYITLQATGYFSNIWTGSPGVSYSIFMKIYIPKLQLNNHLCSGKEYDINDLVLSAPVGVTNPIIDFVDGGNYSSLAQTVNNMYYYECLSTYNGYDCFNPCLATIDSLKEAYWVSTVQTAGIVTSLSPSSLMSNYIYTNGGTLNWWGTGLIMNGNTGWFDPSVASVGNNVMSVCTRNGECFSDWVDTIFYVTPIVNSINQPQVAMSSAFGPGENGIWYAQNITSPTLAGKFHFACSDKNYVFGLSTPPQVGITYEWKAIFQNYVYHTSIGNTFSITMPTRDQVQRNVQSSPFTIQQVLTSGGMYNAGVTYGSGVDVTGDGNYNSDDALNTFYMGDLVKIMVRGVNALGSTSDWSSVLVGLSPTPKIENNSVLCYEANPVLNSVSPYEVYLDSIDEYSVRSTLWDVNNDGVFEYDGTVDNVLQFMTTNQKSDLMISQVVDSVKFYGYNVLTNDWFDSYIQGASTVCFSNVDTVRVVRYPSFNTAFSEVGAIDVSTPILGVISGAWMAADGSDQVQWNWSDGSMTYFGDSCWHYMNDLGSYSLSVTVIDTFGCQVDSLYSNYWYVPGVLNLDEVENLDVSIYPVPCIDILTIETDKNVNAVIIYDLNGKEMMNTEALKIDISTLPSGIYIVEIKLSEGVLMKKINKL